MTYNIKDITDKISKIIVWYGKSSNPIYHCDWGWMCSNHAFTDPFKPNAMTKQEQTPISREERERQIADSFADYVKINRVNLDDRTNRSQAWFCFYKSIPYLSIPPATNELIERIEKAMIDNKKDGWDYLSLLQLEQLLNPKSHETYNNRIV